jgi:hypothetical protein
MFAVTVLTGRVLDTLNSGYYPRMVRCVASVRRGLVKAGAARIFFTLNTKRIIVAPDG